jgi:hypothetical protein
MIKKMTLGKCPNSNRKKVEEGLVGEKIETEA